eukprot:gnl/TRDRNA2_/TRDRNA2_168108_c2_seq1.p1 gnl/TRDRNA2_/TRDRNA2_168108_c2~~gnl/TRDRNA2_/TRDRNA2_168108_c2_seq1.p1  ORF type:complete len:237 (+),score=30.01 gnl/TRDRNA2_/TRDRNA2_168108_c2_seq1:36-713(+)
MALLQDHECQPEPMRGWMNLTSAKDASTLDWVDAGHLDCVRNKAFLGAVIGDMQKLIGEKRSRLTHEHLEDVLSSKCRSPRVVHIEVGGAMQQVYVDPQQGPGKKYDNGRIDFMEAANGVHQRCRTPLLGCSPGYGRDGTTRAVSAIRKPWPDQTRTERQIVLDVFARKNQQLHEAKGRAPPVDDPMVKLLEKMAKQADARAELLKKGHTLTFDPPRRSKHSKHS